MIASVVLAAAVAGVASAAPAVEWRPAHDVAVDLDGDGVKDRLRFGIAGQELVVSLQVQGHEAGELRFERDGIGCNPVDFGPGCDQPRPEVKTFVIDDAGIQSWSEVFEVSAEAFVATGKAEIASFPIGETDPIWFFWNAKQRHLDWLRM